MFFYAHHPKILPVFAGMVPESLAESLNLQNSPRIRGDGPAIA